MRSLSLQNALYGAKLLLGKSPGEEKPKKRSVLKELLGDPDKFVLTASIEDGQIIIRIMKGEQK